MAKKLRAKKSVAKKSVTGTLLPKRRKPKSTETYRLNVTAEEYRNLELHARIKPKLKQRIREASSLRQPMIVSCDDLVYLFNKLCEVSPYSLADPDKLGSLLEQVIELLDAAYDKLEIDLPTNGSSNSVSSDRGKPNKSSQQLFQFKITLRGITPEIWRRIQIPDCDLEYLHLYIQGAFGWENYHLHQFLLDGFTYGMQLDDSQGFGMEWEDETEFYLSQLIPKSTRPYRWLYEYDFGDGWQHEIEFEGCPKPAPRAKYPRCTDGARACPPEDCGGVWGYAHLLDILNDPDHPEYEEILEWCGNIDTEKFNIQHASKEMRSIEEMLPE